jgi:hypothetical protein
LVQLPSLFVHKTCMHHIPILVAQAMAAAAAAAAAAAVTTFAA